MENVDVIEWLTEEFPKVDSELEAVSLEGKGYENINI
jgi:hypothetical protein